MPPGVCLGGPGTVNQACEGGECDVGLIRSLHNVIFSELCVSSIFLDITGIDFPNLRICWSGVCRRDGALGGPCMMPDGTCYSDLSDGA